MMRIRKIAVFIILVLAVAFISGCVEKECETSADCLTKTCFAAQCTDNECVYSSITNCCGNEICEVGENYTGCAADCPNCDDNNDCTVDSYDYHEQKCVNAIIPNVICCGNDRCEIGETYSNCARDCPNCDDKNNCTTDSYDYHKQKCINEPIIPCCGNEICDKDAETYSNCPTDCPNCDDENECTEDSYGYHEQECLHEIIVPCCGNGICDEGVEDLSSCPADCPDCDDDNELTGDSFDYATQQCEYVEYYFFEDFDDGSASWGLGDGWSVVFPEDGTNGMLVSESHAKVTSFGNSSWTDYNFSFKIKPGAGTHVNIRKSPGGSYDLVICEYCMEEGSLYLYRGKSSFDVEHLPELMKEYPFEPDQFYDIKIELNSNIIRVYVNDTLEIAATDDDNPVLSGNVGFDTFHIAYFDEIIVEAPR